MTVISGILTNGNNKPINGTIVFTAKKTTSKVIENTQVIIDVANGNYSVDLLPCDYDVILMIDGHSKNRLDSIRVLADSRNGSLNDYLLNPAESEITSDILQQVVEARDTAKKSANDAKKWAETIDTSRLVKIGERGVLGKAPLLPAGTDLLSDDVLSASQTFSLTGNYAHSPADGITGTLIVTRRAFDAGAAATLEINQSNNKFYKTTARKTNDEWVMDGWVELITTGNSTVDSNGFYKKASPILRLYGTVNIENVDGFTSAGYGLVNDLAKGVTAKRIDVGHYEIHGSLGFAKEGWYIQLPEDANGNKKFFAEYSVNKKNVITVKTFTKKFDFEKCEIVAGEPVDITDGRWIDVRLEMPVVEPIETAEVIESTESATNELEPVEPIKTDKSNQS